MDISISSILTKALDGLAMRQTATAQNIANANSPNYQPLRVSFEEQLKAAASSGEVAIREVQFRAVPTAASSADAGQRLDLELATASETALRYGALIDVLGRELQLTRTIIRGGQ